MNDLWKIFSIRYVTRLSIIRFYFAIVTSSLSPNTLPWFPTIFPSFPFCPHKPDQRPLIITQWPCFLPLTPSYLISDKTYSFSPPSLHFSFIPLSWRFLLPTHFALFFFDPIEPPLLLCQFFLLTPYALFFFHAIEPLLSHFYALFFFYLLLSCLDILWF